MLRPDDTATLDALGLEYTVEAEGNHTCIVINAFPVPDGMRPDSVDLLIRLPPGFPDVAADMFWCSERIVSAATGQPPPATNVNEQHLGRHWVRWSRHPKRQWRSGIDDLRTFLAYVQRCMEHAAGVAA